MGGALVRIQFLLRGLRSGCYLPPCGPRVLLPLFSGGRFVVVTARAGDDVAAFALPASGEGNQVVGGQVGGGSAPVAPPLLGDDLTGELLPG